MQNELNHRENIKLGAEFQCFGRPQNVNEFFKDVPQNN